MTIAKKGTLLIVSGPKHDPERKHLHVVCSDPDEEGNVALVSVCSVTGTNHDTTCILQKHEHAFLKHDSFVLYARAKIVSTSSLTNGMAAELIVMHDDMNGQTFLRVLKGVCRSSQTPRKVKKYLSCVELEAEENAAI
ncbi:conserved hypothetical protein [Gluconacetobacter diazotrophicus PA1 5]|uniref:hypothetical protein n=1 Tax=Gluconacetobacter diazotrophicus TaxID=33996 RepID=UPI000173BBBD|nr:hypothetical protein [Gluconacetobacter diazotrophicus]ACI50722.1 conserved hypothetical protein [Gluconacetobacter diazotrophicus PA1 5]